MPSIISPCAPRNRCRNWRSCPDCARIRQAQIATVAEKGAATSKSTTYAVIRTTAPAQINSHRQALQRKLSPLGIHGGLWTIETGKISTGLHVNLVMGSDEPIVAQQIAQFWPVDGEVWCQQISQGDVRNVAAYSAKAEGFPEKDEYPGRLFGSWGSWKTPLQACAGQDQYTTAKALAMEQQLASAGIEVPEPPNRRPGSKCRETWEKERIYHLRRVLAAAAGEIDAKGMAYVPGYGLARREDLAAVGIVLPTTEDAEA